MWDDNEIAATRDGIKRLHHAELGVIELEFSTFAVEGRSDLKLMIYNPANSEVAAQFRLPLQPSPRVAWLSFEPVRVSKGRPEGRW